MFVICEEIKRQQAGILKTYEFIGVDPKCGTPGLTPGLRQKILEFHKEAKSLQWDCGLEQKAHDAITEDGVDYNKIGGRVNEYTEMPKGMETDVEEALDYWWNKDPRDGHANV
ncbi:hypothetical protein ANCCAN_12253 [Ancylostoma caninum]|uniref:Uncharacterized protein n=1 Tax=Ancylostoma caninum TaxID=29170 RepID=A0A368GG11_ANCCA|nr:hypothetical protein ANCCAN_12253 [Ancylostoma caninum]